MNNSPIGMFDSGIGGITIFNSIKKLLPNEDIIYYSDNLNSPYGNKSKSEIIRFSIKNTKLLIDKGCKIIIVACNTATTNSIEELRANFKIPFVGIEPAIKPAAMQTKSGLIGVLATKGTLASGLFSNTANNYGSDIKIIEKNAEGLVELIERGIFEGEEIEKILLVDECRKSGSHAEGLYYELHRKLNRNVKIKLHAAENSFISLGIAATATLPSKKSIITCALELMNE